MSILPVVPSVSPYLPVTSIAFMEVFVSEEIASERCHWLDETSRDLVEIFKLLRGQRQESFQTRNIKQ